MTFDEGFLVFHIQVYALKPLFSIVWYPCGCFYGFSWNCEADPYKNDLISPKVSGKQVGQLGMTLDLLNLLTEP